MNKVNVRIVTPKREMYSGSVDMVIFRSTSGDVGIMHGHIPMVTVVDYGVLRLVENNQVVKRAAIFGGFAKVDKEGVSILTDTAEWADEIDLDRAKEARARAEKRLNTHSTDVDDVRAEMALRRAIIRINAVENKKTE